MSRRVLTRPAYLPTCMLPVGRALMATMGISGRILVSRDIKIICSSLVWVHRA